jgi:hypothetical protein
LSLRTLKLYSHAWTVCKSEDEKYLLVCDDTLSKFTYLRNYDTYLELSKAIIIVLSIGNLFLIKTNINFKT